MPDGGTYDECKTSAMALHRLSLPNDVCKNVCSLYVLHACTRPALVGFSVDVCKTSANMTSPLSPPDVAADWLRTVIILRRHGSTELGEVCFVVPSRVKGDDS